jgi:hypothetical protein
MKLSNLLAASLTVLSVLTVSMSAAEARNPAKGGSNGSSGCTTTLNVVQVFPAECGTNSATQAAFIPTTGFPLSVNVAESTVLTAGYAGAVVFIPTTNLNLVDLSTFTPIASAQGVNGTSTFSQSANFIPGTYTGDPNLEQAVAYSWLNNNNVQKFGISFVPASFINGSTAFTNHAIKGKSFELSLVSNIHLLDLFNAGDLVNLIGNDPGKNAHDFKLLGLGTALINLGSDGTTVSGTFNNFAINGTLLAKDTCPADNINCAFLIPIQPAAAAAARAK